MITADQADWQTLSTARDEKGVLDPSRYFLVAGRYFFCFKAQLVLRDRIPVICLDDNPIRHALAADDKAIAGHNALIIENWWRGPQSLPSVLASFESVERLEPLCLRAHNRPVIRLDLSIRHTPHTSRLP